MIKDRTHQFLTVGRSWYQRDPKTITKITVHHTAGTTDGSEDFILNSVRNTHANTNGWPGISYHFFYIPKRFKGHSGKVIKLNNVEDVTWHDAVNWDSIGFCIHGYYHPDINQTLTDEDFAIIKEFLDYLCTENPQFPASEADVYGHRERQQTACPGDFLFPYVKEYRVNEGNVDWGSDSCISLEDDLPAEIEDKFKLKEKAWYSKYWTLEQFIQDSIKAHDQITTLEKSVSDKKKEITQLNSLINSLSSEKNNLQITLTALQKMHGDLTIQYDDTKQELVIARSDLEIEKTEHGKLKTLYETALQRVEEYKDLNIELSLDNERLKAQKFTITESLNFLISAIKGGGTQ